MLFTGLVASQWNVVARRLKSKTVQPSRRGEEAKPDARTGPGGCSRAQSRGPPVRYLAIAGDSLMAHLPSGLSCIPLIFVAGQLDPSYFAFSPQASGLVS